jgi:glycosyltransferase involved in cell wall biosynthesis
MARRLRVLLSAYYCSPYRGSESAVGWQVASGLARDHDVTLICGDLSEPGPTACDLERYRKEHGMPDGLEIVHVPANRLARRIHDLHRFRGLWFLYYEAYRRWQRQAFASAQELHAARPFDLVHHLNIIGFREPGYLWQLGIPFFWGPTTGAALIPRAYLKEFGSKERFRWASRNALNSWQIRHARRSAAAARNAAKIWAVSPEDRAMFHRWGVEADPMLETGARVTETAEIRQRSSGEPLRLCWSGLFQGIKALPLVLRALAASGDLPVLLDVLGDGVEKERWKRDAARLGLESRIRWHGMLPRDEALQVMSGCHALVHSSVKEGTPHVVLEAMAMGLPVICHNACGMGTAVDERSGIKVELSGPEESTVGFRAAIHRLLSETGLLGSLSQGAIERARALAWQVNIERMRSAYESVTLPSRV